MEQIQENAKQGINKKDTADVRYKLKLSLPDRMFFTKHLAVLIKSGISLSESMESLTLQKQSKGIQEVSKSALQDIQNGLSLYKSLVKFQKSFDHLYLNIINVAETSGTLEENLEFLADQLAKEYEIRNKVKSAMIYPMMVIATLFVMTGLLSIFVLPKLAEVFTNFSIDLPWMTLAVIWIAKYSIHIFGSMVAILILSILVLRSSRLANIRDRMLLNMPFVGRLVRLGQIAQFSRSLGISIRAGLPIMQALEVTSQGLSSPTLKRDTNKLISHVKEGGSLTSVIQDNSLVFTPVAHSIIAAGERTGKLDELLLYLGDFYQQELEAAQKDISSVLEPVLMIVVGLAVAGIALATIMPVYNFTANVREAVFQQQR